MNVKKYFALLVLAATAVAALTLSVQGGNSEQTSDSQESASGRSSSRLYEAAKNLEVPAQLSQLLDSDNSNLEEEPELVEGAIARKWGTFIKARDIYTNCRTVRMVTRDVPQPDDYGKRCDTRTEFEHPYTEFSDDQLAQIADYDGAAAYLLSYRMLMGQTARDRQDLAGLEAGLSHAMNALILTGESQAFDLLIDGRQFRNRMVWDSVDGVPNEREIREKEEQYKWLKAGRDLGFIEDDDYRWKSTSLEIDRFKQYFDVEELNSRAQQLSEEILQRRSIVEGEGQ